MRTHTRTILALAVLFGCAVAGANTIKAQAPAPSSRGAAAGPTRGEAPSTPTRWDAWSPIDNQHVHVTAEAAAGATPVSTLPQVRIWLDGHVQYLQPGAHPETHAAATSRGPAAAEIVIDLKDTQIPPHKNGTSYPLAFPRPGSKKVLENDRVIIWDYSWTPGSPTPMHFHDKDVVVTYLEDGALRSTEPNGQAVVNPHYFGFTKFNAGDRTHTEELIRGKGRAIIVELKR
jgi:hypothetical protein